MRRINKLLNDSHDEVKGVSCKTLWRNGWAVAKLSQSYLCK